MAGHILADEGEGEVPCIPEMICVVSTEAERQRSNEADAAANDPIACLINSIVQLVLVLDEGKSAGRKEVCSPLLAQTCTWFFSRYLCVCLCMFACVYREEGRCLRRPVHGFLAGTYVCDIYILVYMYIQMETEVRQLRRQAHLF
jgi:hypothetical protein